MVPPGLASDEWPPRDVEGMRQLLRTLWPTMRPSEATLQRAVEGLAREQAVAPVGDLDLFGNQLGEEYEARLQAEAEKSLATAKLRRLAPEHRKREGVIRKLSRLAAEQLDNEATERAKAERRTEERRAELLLSGRSGGWNMTDDSETDAWIRRLQPAANWDPRPPGSEPLADSAALGGALVATKGLAMLRNIGELSACKTMGAKLGGDDLRALNAWHNLDARRDWMLDIKQRLVALAAQAPEVERAAVMRELDIVLNPAHGCRWLRRFAQELYRTELQVCWVWCACPPTRHPYGPTEPTLRSLNCNHDADQGSLGSVRQRIQRCLGDRSGSEAPHRRSRAARPPPAV